LIRRRWRRHDRLKKLPRLHRRVLTLKASSFPLVIKGPM
jgi:hypothetical protein